MRDPKLLKVRFIRENLLIAGIFNKEITSKIGSVICYSDCRL